MLMHSPSLMKLVKRLIKRLAKNYLSDHFQEVRTDRLCSGRQSDPQIVKVPSKCPTIAGETCGHTSTLLSQPETQSSYCVM